MGKLSFEGIIDWLENAINGNKKDISTMNSNVSNLKTNVTEIQTDVDNLKTSTTSVQNDISNLQEAVSALDGVSGLETRVSDLETAMDGTQNDVSTLQTTVDELQTTVSSLDDTSGFDDRISDLESSTGTLSTDVGKLKTDVSGLQDSMGDAETNISDLQTSVTNLETAIESIDSGGGGSVPKDHSSETDEYGAATSTKYGHVQLSNDYEGLINQNKAMSGVALSVLRSDILFSSLSDIYMHLGTYKNAYLTSHKSVPHNQETEILTLSFDGTEDVKYPSEIGTWIVFGQIDLGASTVGYRNLAFKDSNDKMIARQQIPMTESMYSEIFMSLVGIASINTTMDIKMYLWQNSGASLKVYYDKTFLRAIRIRGKAVDLHQEYTL